jgi:hypothetical protein
MGGYQLHTKGSLLLTGIVTVEKLIILCLGWTCDWDGETRKLRRIYFRKCALNESLVRMGRKMRK